MAIDDQLNSGLAAISADYQLPSGGRMMLSRLVRAHLWWFVAAEKRGMSSRDMAAALASVGVVSGNGGPISVGALSSTVWRSKKQPNVNLNPDVRSGGRIAAKTSSNLPNASPADTSGKRRSEAPKKLTTVSNATPYNSTDTLSYMRRAQKLRQEE